MKKKEEIILTKEQEAQIDDFYDDKGVTAIKELVALIFPNIDEKYRDGRTVVVKKISFFLIQFISFFSVRSSDSFFASRC